MLSLRPFAVQYPRVVYKVLLSKLPTSATGCKPGALGQPK